MCICLNTVACQVQYDTTITQLLQEQDSPAPSDHQYSHPCTQVVEAMGGPTLLDVSQIDRSKNFGTGHFHLLYTTHALANATRPHTDLHESTKSETLRVPVPCIFSRKQRYFGSTALMTPESPKFWQERSKIAIPTTEEELQNLNDVMN